LKFGLQKFKLIRLISFVLALVITFLYIHFFWDRIIVNDASYYWTTVTSSNLDLLPITFRGYFFPYLIFAVKTLSISLGFSEYFLFVLMNSVLCALFVTVFLPAIAVGGVKRSWDIPTTRYLIGTALVLFFVLYFWPDFIMYPLSDFPALVFCGAAIYLMMMIYETISQNGKEKKHTDAKKIILVLILSILAGLCVYATYNTRAIYLYGLIISFVIWLIINRKSNKTLLFTALIGLIIGAFIIAYPQMHVNKMYLGTYLPIVPTQNFYGADLMKVQLALGLKADRFETFAGSDSVQVDQAMVFEDEAGVRISQLEGLTNLVGVKQIVGLTMKYPIDMVGIYSRHIINYLTPIWNHAYIKDLRINNALFIVPGILLWLVAGYCLLLYSRQQYKRWLIDEAWVQLPLIIICLFMIPGFVEMRFFISGYFLMYGFLCYRVNFRDVYLQSFKKHPIRITMVMLFIFLMWISIIGTTLATNIEDVLLISK